MGRRILTAYFFERIELPGVILYQVNIGKTTFAEQPQDLEGAVVDGEVRRRGKTRHTGRQGVHEIEEILRHRVSRCVELSG